MSTASDLSALRRAAFREARRRGDPLAAARAAAQMRLDDDELDPRDQATLRASRLVVGRAIRDARARRRNPAVVMPFLPSRPARRFPFALAAAVAIAATLLFALFLQPDERDGGGGAPAAVPSAPVRSTAPQSLGRVKVALPVIVPVVEQPKPTTAPVVVVDPNAFPTDELSVVPGPGAGAGTGPGLASCPASVPPGFARLCGQVIDLSTGKGLIDACMSLGPCKETSTRTDANGRWALVLPIGNGDLTWFLEFSKTGYTTSKFTQSSRLGRTLIPTQQLSPFR
jgi:hypothetical protein